MAAGGGWLVTGTIALTTEVVGSIDDADADPSNPTPHTKVRLTDVEVVAGRAQPTLITAYLTGGILDGIKTYLDATVQNGWSTDGRFFGSIYSSNGVNLMGWVLPLVAGNIVIPPIGCWTTQGIANRGNASEVLVFDGRTVTMKKGRWPTVSLDSVRRTIRSASVVSITPSG